MELLRITLAGIMALLVSMPFGVCEDSCADEQPVCEERCCSELEGEELTACDCGCVDACPAFRIEKRDFITADEEVSAPDTPELAISLPTAADDEAFMASAVGHADRLRGPPDLFARSSRQIIHCVFRW